MSAPQLLCLQCGSPIAFPPGQSTHFQCPKCGTAFDLVPKAADPTAIVEAVPVIEGPFASPPVAPPPAAQPVVVLPLPAPAPVARDEYDDETEHDRPSRRRRRRDEDDDEEDEDDRRGRRESARRDGPKKRPDSGAKVAVIVCAAAVLLVVVAVGGYFAFRPAPKEKDVARKDAPAAPAPKKDAKKDDGPLTTEQLLRKVKPSTVYIRAFNRDGTGGTGTGFFAGKPGHVVTNAHVVGYKFGEIRRPDRVDVVVDSGDAGERTVAAEIFGLDVALDLAVLKVEPRGMPPLLKFGKAEALIETQDVVAFGFPFGEVLGPAMTVSSTKVSSLRRERGTLEKVQLAGGLNPGNSGGPVTNVRGEVVGVSVAKLRDAEIAFAIPAETAERFLEDMFASNGGIRTGGAFGLPDGPGVPAPPVAPPARAAGWPPLRVPPPRPVAPGAPQFADDTAEVKPAAAVGGACVAGGGRFLILHLRDDDKLAVLDLTTAKVVKTIPVPAGALFAAGAESLVVVDAEDDKVERWSLATFTKEAEADLPVSRGLTATAVALGGASNGPVMVQALDFPRLGERFLLDLATLKEVPGSRTSDGTTGVRPGDELRASGDGRTFARWNPDGRAAVVLVTDTGYHEAPLPVKAPAAALPGGDGQSVYAGEEIVGRGGLRSGAGAGRGGAYVPAASGPLFLSLPKPGGATFGVHAGRDRKPLFEVPVPPALAAVLDRDAVPQVGGHVFFVPAAGVLAVVSPARDKVTLHKLDVDALLEKADDYLFVTSVPPPAVSGKPVEYQLVVKSKKPPTAFRAVFGPKDIAVSDTGRLTCAGPPPRVHNHVPVMVAITDAAGKPHRYEFELVPTPAPPE